MKPNSVNDKNEQQLLNDVYNYHQLYSSSKIRTLDAFRNIHPKIYPKLKLQRVSLKFQVGDYVRLSKYRTVFEKSYTPNWTTEIFRIRKVQNNTNPITYLLEDYLKREIKGSVYAEELQPVMHPDVYLVEKIIRKRNGRVYVKWLGFGSEHNSWILEKDLI